MFNNGSGVSKVVFFNRTTPTRIIAMPNTQWVRINASSKNQNQTNNKNHKVKYENKLTARKLNPLENH